jgi:hypothetical protein
MNPEKKEMEKVRIEVPKAVMDFLRRAEKDVQAYLRYSLLTIVQSDLNSCEGVWPDKTEIEPILEEYLKA